MKNGMYEDVLGSKRWFKDGQYHREDGPAYERADGYKAWYKDGKLHRVDGHAQEWEDGEKRWYLNGKIYSFDDWLKATPVSDEDKLFLKLKWT